MATIFVDFDLCTHCGICSVICPISIIDMADKNSFPDVLDENAGRCIACGHCEVSCPTDALTLNVRPEEKVPVPDDAGALSAGELSIYLKKRRSVRHFTDKPVPKELILQILDVARYAASGRNEQPVEWLVVYEPENVRTVARMTTEWMKTLVNTSHPLSGYVSELIAAQQTGHDVICHDAPHLLFARIPKDMPIAPTDAIIALTHFDLAAPAFGIGTCWAGFVSMAARYYEPLQKELALPEDQTFAYAMLFGHPKYKTHGLPRRKPVRVTWR